MIVFLLRLGRWTLTIGRDETVLPVAREATRAHVGEGLWARLRQRPFAGPN